MSIEKKASVILSEAADNLKVGEWGQNNYIRFLPDEVKTPCFCAHGSIQFCGNPSFKGLVEKKKAATTDVTTTAAADYGAAETTEQAAIDYYQKYYAKHYPDQEQLFLAHFYAWKVGCSFSFNDTPGRTKEEVIAKLRKASLLAQAEE